MDAPFGIIDPNSQHQMWSRWVFGVQANPAKAPQVKHCIDNARRFFAAGFKSHVGRVRCDRQGLYYCFIVEIEGPPAHDSDYARSVKDEFIQKFMQKGFGSGACLKRFEVMILAGDQQDGKPPEQMLVMPTINLRPFLQGDQDGQRSL